MTAALPRSVLVLGLGRSGLAATRLALAGAARVRVSDRRTADELRPALEQLPGEVERVLGGHPDSSLDGIEAVVVSPGVAAEAPILEAARRRGIAVLSEVEYAWLHRPDAPLVAVTGSNGKSTVTVLAAEMLNNAGIAAVAGGNLGTAACDLVLGGGWQAWVLEVSSFQSELFVKLRPRVGLFLNLSQDHLERHPSLEVYRDAKRRLFAAQRGDDLAVLNADDPASAETPTAARRRCFSLRRPADATLAQGRVLVDGEPLIEVAAMALRGLHNVANAMAAALAALELGASREAVASTLAVFAGLDHRHRTVHEEAGVGWVDDSKATNVGATAAALEGYPQGSLHLILGGQGKGQDFSPLREPVRRAVARLYLIGVDASQIAEALAGCAPMEHCGTLEEAVRRIRRRAASGQWALLSPACASFDQFSSYAERGDRFAALARGGGGSCP